MTGWRHSDRGWDKGCGAPSDVPGFVNCGCSDPRPDPASPCGYEFAGLTEDGIGVRLCREALGHDFHSGHYAKCRPDHDPHVGCHPHLPTLCLNCGHGITEVPA